jgi:hypothetical protein
MTTHKLGPITWADIEIKIDPDAPPMTEMVHITPGEVEHEATLVAPVAALPDELRAALASGYAVLPSELARALMLPMPPPRVCVRLYDADGALLERTGGCFCNTLDCPHRPAKGA